MKKLAFGQLFWRRHDPGWYKHPAFGDIQREWGQWFWYPKGHGDPMKSGPFDTLARAIELAEREGKKN